MSEVVVRNKVKQRLHKIPFVFDDKGYTLYGRNYSKEGIHPDPGEHQQKSAGR